MPVVV